MPLRAEMGSTRLCLNMRRNQHCAAVEPGRRDVLPNALKTHPTATIRACRRFVWRELDTGRVAPLVVVSRHHAALRAGLDQDFAFAGMVGRPDNAFLLHP